MTKKFWPSSKLAEDARCSTMGILLCAISVLIFFSGGAFAQINTATLSGSVTDSSGAVVQGATVTILQIATGATRTTATNEAGLFSEPFMQTGMFKVAVTKAGFQNAVESVQLVVGQRADLKITMTVGAVSQTVTVTEAAPDLQTQTASLGTVIGNKEIDQLPLNGRQFAQLLQLAPGTAPVSVSQSSVPQLGANGSNITPSMNGGTGRSNLFFVDGLLAIDPMYSTLSISPAVDGIQEFQEQTHTDQTQFGGGAAATVNVDTKSGGNQYHGTAYEFFRNQAIQAAYFYAPVKGTFQQNQYGGTLGGPIIHNKLFFFGWYDGYRYTQNSTIASTLPTAAELGNFGAADANFTALYGSTTPVLFDPYSYNATTGAISPFGPSDPVHPSSGYNIIPRALLNPGMMAELKAFLPSTLPTDATTFPNYRNNQPNTVNQDQYSVRVDYNPTTKDTLFARWTINEATALSPQQIPGNQWWAPFNGNNSGGAWTHTFSPNLLMQIDVGYNSLDTPGAYGEPNADAVFKAGGFSAGFPEFPGNTPDPSVPSIGNTGGYFGTNAGSGAGLARTLQVSGSVTRQFGQHSLNVGASYFHTSNLQSWQGNANNFSNEATWQPCYQGTPGSSTTPCQGNSDTGNSIASMVLGLPQSASTLLGNSGVFLTMQVSDAYAQDSWKLTQKMTVNYGFRWDYTTPTHEAHNLFSGFDLNSGLWYMVKGNTDIPTYALPSWVTILDRSTITTPNYDNYAPRLGLSYQIAPTWVVNAGIGVSWDSWSGAEQAAQNARGSWPSGYSPSVPNGSVNTAGVSYYGSNVLNAQNPFGPPPVFPTSPYGNGGAYFNPAWKNSYTWGWNLQVQKQLGQSGVVKFSYVGSASSRLTSQVPRQISLALGPTYNEPFPQLGTPWLWDLESIGHAHYNAFEAQYNHHNSHGLTATAAFTYSKNIDSGCADFWEGCNIQNPYDMKSNKGSAPIDVPLIFTASATYDLPFGKGKAYANSGASSAVLGGWQVNGIVSSHVGTVFTAGLSGNYGDWENATGGACCTNAERPNASGSLGGPKTLAKYFNTSAYSLPARYTYGNAGYNSLRGPGYNDVDFSLFRNFAFKEHYNIQFRAEAYNLFNHPNFANPDASFGDPNFGQITGTNGSYGPREYQFAGTFKF